MPIQAVVISSEEAREGLHTISPSFREHLELSVGRYGFHGENPLDMLADNGEQFADSLLSSLQIYVSTLKKRHAESEKSDRDRARFLKVMLEKPVHAMRVVCQHKLGQRGILSIGQDTAGSVREVYGGLGLDSSFCDRIDELRDAARAYVAFLDNAASKEPGEYKRLLDSMDSHYPLALGFLRDSLRLLR